MKLLFLMVFALFMVESVVGVEQKCGKFTNGTRFVYFSNGPGKLYHCCDIYDANLTNENEPVTTNTELNERSNDNVTAVYYTQSSVVKFIPNSLFTTFINLELLHINHNSRFETIKPEFFENANKLKKFTVYKNEIRTLEANLFANALNLEEINLERNRIQSIHKFTFNGLKNLKFLFLQHNKISNLHSSTFSLMNKLNILELSNNTCISQRFVRVYQKVSEVERAIQESCGYYHDELAGIGAAKKLIELERIAAELRIDLERTNEVRRRA